MTVDPRTTPCADCSDVTRRTFLKSSAVGAAVVSTGVPLLGSSIAMPGDTPETLVAQFYKSLTEAQRKSMAFPFDHPLRQKVDNNWKVTKTTVGSLSGDQQAMVYDIMMGLHSEEYAKPVMHAIHQDHGGARGGFNRCAVAMFGEPGKDFEFVLSGRHVTRRCDGNSVDGAAFGGPIFYGHEGLAAREKPDHPENVYWFQGKRANEVFQALDGKQRKLALRSDPRREQGTRTVKLSGKTKGLHGIPMSELSRDQKGLVQKVMKDLLAPFRKKDAEETMKLVHAGGFDNVHMAFYKNLDIGNDGVWDVWQLEGPAMIWYFRGHPHIHTWVHVRKPHARRDV